MDYKIISVTGTKGKTSIVRALDAVLAPYVQKRLRVDTEGAWLNGRRKFTHQDSKRIWGLAPANAPGRFLSLLASKPQSHAAILETNLFCSGPCGLGYNAHNVGIFSNVYAEHLGSVSRLKNVQDIAKAKSFIFSRIDKNGYAVFNADDTHVVSMLGMIPKRKGIRKIACSVSGPVKKIPSEMQLFIEKDEIILLSGTKRRSLGRLDSYKTFLPGFPPSPINILLILGGLIGYFDGKIKPEAIKRLQSYQPEPDEGRMVVFKARTGTRVVFDFAHESESLLAVAKLARSLSPHGRVIGVLRLSPSKTDGLIKQIAAEIASSYDHFVVYDKVDGTSRRPDESLNPFRQEKVGYVSKLFAEALREIGDRPVERIINEEKALKRAISIAKKDDIIVFILGNDAKNSLEILRRSFNGRLRRTA